MTSSVDPSSALDRPVARFAAVGIAAMAALALGYIHRDDLFPGETGSAGATAAAASTGAAAVQTDAPSMSFQVEFAFASAELDPTARALLDELGTALASEQLAPYRFRLTGHTDAVGEAGYNKGLSERRARAVREYLVSKFSISRQRLDSVGMGESRLLDQDRPDAAVNRRVEITNIGLVDG